MNKKIAIVSHVNPFSSGSGQVQRVYNTLLALTEDWNTITVYTIDENKSNKSRIEKINQLHNNVTIIYIKKPIYLKFLAPFFHILTYFGYGKSSNFSIPIIFKNIKKELAGNYDVVLFEYWHLYKLAKKLKDSGAFVVCDTHNILSGSYLEYITAKKWLPKFYREFLIKKYYHLEFNVALKHNFSKIIAINKEEEIIFKQKFSSENVYYCPMGVCLPKFDASKINFLTKDQYTVIYYGGLGNERNSKAAIEVYIELKKIENIPFHYKIIGSNPPQVINDIIKQDKRVSVSGYIENISEAFNHADIAIIPFKGKFGFRSRLIELMHFGVPVLTTQDAIWGMGFQEKENVLIIEKKNLFLQIEALLLDFELRTKIAVMAKNRVEEEFAFESTYKKLSQDLLKMTNLN